MTVKKYGKLIVAIDRSQAEALKALNEACGVKDLELLTKHEVETMEPALQVESDLLSPSTGGVDVQGFYRPCKRTLKTIEADWSYR